MMDNQVLLGLLFTILPITELRVGLPIIVDYCMKNSVSIAPYFALVVLANILVIFLIYVFLDFVHRYLLYLKWYSKLFGRIVDRIREKNKKFEEKFNRVGYLALIIFVAVPLPGTGAWTGTLLAWLLGLEKKKSVIAISLGVFIAGLIMLFSSFGVLSLFYT